jgi:hypothetical protein
MTFSIQLFNKSAGGENISLEVFKNKYFSMQKQLII